MPPKDKLVGIRGQDYHFVRSPSGHIYVVYSIKTFGGNRVSLAWRVSKDQYKAFGIDPKKVKRITRTQARGLNVFGGVEEIVVKDTKRQKHPWKKFLEDVGQMYGSTSWMKDKEYMSVLLDGFMEGLGQDEIGQRLTQTKWFQARTQAQRQWEQTGKEEKEQILRNMTDKVKSVLEELYGPDTPWADHVDEADMGKWVENIASGDWGDPSDGFETWADQQRRKAEEVEGTKAWQNREADLEEQRAFMNRPEDVYESLRGEALKWLGPASKGTPFLSDGVLRQWSEDLVSKTKSEADWDQFIRGQASKMYPFLGTDQTWMEFADPYKSKAEALWGTPIDWSDEILGGLQGQDDSGNPTGMPVSMGEFERLARSRPAFWQGDTARGEGFDLIDKLNSMFNGV